MPLKLWLPLNSDAENRGISGIYMSGTPYAWVPTGPYGGYASFNNDASKSIESTSSALNYVTEDFSWSMWLTKDYSAITESSMWAFAVGRAGGGGRGYGLKIQSSTQVRTLFGNKSWDVDGFADNSWHHIAFTRRGTEIRIYLDGVLYTSATFSDTLPTYSDGNGPRVGSYYNAANKYPLIGGISDFRIYSHALSAKEVYDISKTLLAHYPLTSPLDANPNMFGWSRDYTSATPYVHTSAAADGYKSMGADSLVTVTPGHTYYIQVKCDHAPKASHGNGGVISDQFTFWLYVRKQGTTKSVGGYDSTVCFTNQGSSVVMLDDTRHLYVWKWTAPSTAQDITLRTNTYSDGTTPVTMKFWDFKFEDGSYTAYVPPRNSPQYSEMGLGTIENFRDASGHGYDLVLDGASGITYDDGCPRYHSSVYLSGLQELSRTVNMQLTKFTVALWIKSGAGSGYVFRLNASSGSSSTAHIEMTRSSNVYYNIFLSTDSPPGGSPGNASVTEQYADGEWHHVVLTNSADVRLYVDGELSKTTTISMRQPFTVNSMRLGGRYDGDCCNISDFRLYATELSSDDVRYLYSTSAAMTDRGDLHAYTISEFSGNTGIDRDGTVRGRSFSETGGSVCATKKNSAATFDSNNDRWSYVPKANANNSCMDFATFNVVPGVSRYHVGMVVEWSGFDDISTSSPDFGANFHGVCRLKDGTTDWSSNPLTAALRSVSWLKTLLTGAGSGVFRYEADMTLTSAFMETYSGCDIGFRVDYSNGTGTVGAYGLRIYPADEDMYGTVSMCSSGAVQARLVDEGRIA